ncbi:MAG: hypothetical protein IV100_06555 [Myxococcales bacterium]|nr:hypothetical protein [Myxococcales bacterium]
MRDAVRFTVAAMTATWVLSACEKSPPAGGATPEKATAPASAAPVTTPSAPAGPGPNVPPAPAPDHPSVDTPAAPEGGPAAPSEAAAPVEAPPTSPPSEPSTAGAPPSPALEAADPSSALPAPELAAVQLALGDSAACARMANDTVRCWGRGDFGELGDVPQVRDATTPVEVKAPGGGPLQGAKRLVVGGNLGDHADTFCALLADRTVCWGGAVAIPRNSAEPAADGSDLDPVARGTSPREVPVLAGILDLALGGGTGYAVKSDGSVIAWGNGAYGALGDGKGKDSLIPVPIAGVTGARAVAAGQNHGCALLGDGSVTCWGYEGPQQLPKTVPGLADVTSLVSGVETTTTCAITRSDEVLCFGADQLVGPPPRPASAPGAADLPGAPSTAPADPIVELAARNHWCSRSKAGAVTCHGANDVGQTGRGNRDFGYEPEPIKGLGAATGIAAGLGFTCAITDGHVRCVGRNDRGQLGDSTLNDSLTPKLVQGLGQVTLPPPGDGLTSLPSEAVIPDTALPDGCVRDPAIEFNHPAYPGPFTLITSSATSAIRGTAVIIVLADHLLMADNLFAAPRGNQRRLQIRLSRLGKHERIHQTIIPGSYTSDQGMRDMAFSNLYTRDAPPSGIPFGDVGGAGKVDVKVLTDEWICGSLELKKGDQLAKGNFAARFISAPEK